MLYSQRNGITRSYSSAQLYDILTRELKKWEVYQLFLQALGGSIYFDVDETKGEPKEFEVKRNIEEPDIFFRRGLVHDMVFNFWDADTFFKNLPGSLSPRVSGNLNLFFDFIEFIYPLAADPVLSTKTGKLTYNKRNGQKIFRERLNPDLALFNTPLQLLSNGQIVEISNRPLVDLTEETLQIIDTGGIAEKTAKPIRVAISNYIKRGASLEDKKQAVRNLADSLESIRDGIHKHLLTADENALFQIANEFAIRHNSSKQKSEYDEGIWYDWMFHVNLAALLTVIKILKEQHASTDSRT